MENLKNTNAENQNENKELTLEEKLAISEASNKEKDVKIEGLETNLKTRDTLIGILSHDVRTSIGNIPSMADMLIENINDKTSNEKSTLVFLNLISNQGRDAYTLFENLLTWIQLQKNGIKAEILQMNLVENVENSIATLKQPAKNKNINLENKIQSDIEVLADSMMLQTIIRNLTSNAVKFTENGGSVSITGGKKGNMVEIFISDTGLGLSEDQKKKIFDNVGVTKMGTKGEKGAGVGLSICNEMICKMGGTIDVESELGKGTTFIVSIPAVENKA